MCNSKKKCSICGEEKDLCEFHNRKKSKDGKSIWCKSCQLEWYRKKNGVDPKNYRISRKEKQELFEKGLKICYKCKEIKGLCEFNNHKRTKDGKESLCKSCKLDYERKRNGVNPKNYTLEKEKRKQELFEKGLKKCPKCKEIKDLNEFGDNNEKKDNKHSNCRSCLNEKRNQRRKNDPLFRLSRIVSSTIHNSLKRKGYIKDSEAEKILRCSYEEFKSHIESKFEPWMTWENQGLFNGTENYGWDLDHIVPISSATTEAEVIELNHYTNFQPLCSHINRYVKRDRLDYYQ